MQFLSLNDAYQIQKRQWNQCNDVAAWKLGGTNFVTKDLFKVTELYFGFLSRENIIVAEDPKINRFNDFELELCFKIPNNFDLALDYSLDDIAGWDKYFGLEFPSTCIADLPTKGVAHLVADNCAAGSLVISNIRCDNPTLSMYKMLVGQKNSNYHLDLIDDTPSIVKQFLDISKLNGFEVVGGQYIATGGISKIHRLSIGEKVDVFLEDKLVLRYVHN
jgi:hypothetical protein